MARKAEDSSMVREIKKDYLKEHLNSVKNLITRWMTELSAPCPLAPREGLWGWVVAYRVSTEQDPDNNHMLRHHLKSHALWNYHANWEKKLDETWHLVSRVRKQADIKDNERLEDRQRRYSKDYIDVALWKAFELASGETIQKWYKVPDDQRGVDYGAYTIETSAASPEERFSIEKEHWSLIYDLAELKEIKDLAAMWCEVSKVQEKMQAIAGKALKANDILYPCRFCRHLWK